MLWDHFKNIIMNNTYTHNAAHKKCNSFLLLKKQILKWSQNQPMTITNIQDQDSGENTTWVRGHKTSGRRKEWGTFYLKTKIKFEHYKNQDRTWHILIVRPHSLIGWQSDCLFIVSLFGWKGGLKQLWNMLSNSFDIY